MPTTQNPTPASDPRDTNHDGMVDADDDYVDDGTGMHPTRTTFATTTVASSLTVGDETATPTYDSYHKIELAADVKAFNGHVGNDLSFNNETETWSNYNHHDDEYNRVTFLDGTNNPKLWVEGFKPAVSWDYTSKITGNDYLNICPTVIYHANNQTVYYFFREVFDDFQAFHGWANYSYTIDGFPGPDWPGMIEVYRSQTGDVQVPQYYLEYQNWFATTYGRGFGYAAPFMVSLNRMPLVVPPTRPRHADPTRDPRDAPVDVVADLPSEDEDDEDTTAEVLALRAAAASRTSS